ncbi:hypothetical protein FQN54_006570 [Arachnomyces sp. PD_36]|nr:hypothetical protein FQN54_006570 [Arachnomyces sp. PD_36]
MSRRPPKKEDPDDMAVSYPSGSPVGRSQTLPSIRELLPPHLHDEIDSTSYRAPPGRQQQGSPTQLGQSTSSKPRSVPDSVSIISQSKPPAGGTLNDFSLRPSRPGTENQLGAPESHGSRPTHGAGTSSSPSLTPGITSQFAPRGPSPILPPIQDFKSLPERNLNQQGNPYSMGGRHSAFSQDHGGDPSREGDSFEHKYHDPEFDRTGPQRYRGSATPLQSIESRYTSPHYDSSRYGQYNRPYRGDLEYSPQHVNSPQSSNFGVLGDPVDPRNKRRRGNLPKPVTDVLRAWFLEHLDHPYPSEEDKQMFITRTGLTISQISNWFINARRRHLPALRNQARSQESERGVHQPSPLSDAEHATFPPSSVSP